LWTAEVGILIDRDRSPAEDLDGSNLIIQLNLGNICAPLPAEIISSEIDILEEASSATGPAVLMTALTGIPPRRSSLFASGVDLEPSATPSIHPDSIGVIAPGLAADTPYPAKLLHQGDLGVRIRNSTGLEPVMARLAGEGLSLAVLRSRFRWSEKKQDSRRNYEPRITSFHRESPFAVDFANSYLNKGATAKIRKTLFQVLVYISLQSESRRSAVWLDVAGRPSTSKQNIS
jgi:hypothetical protein